MNYVRDKETGKPKGFCFLKYDDQRSTVLAVDNFNGAQILGRTLRVDHSRDYRQKKKRKRRRDGESESESEESEEELDEEGKPRVKGFNVAPKGWLDPPVEETDQSEEDDLAEGIDPDDPMRDYLIEKRREERGSKKEKSHRHKRIKEEGDDEERKHRHRHRSRRDGEERHRHRHRRSSHHRRIEDKKNDAESRRDMSPDAKDHQYDRDDTPPRSGHAREETPERSHRQYREDRLEKSRRDRDLTPERRPRHDRPDDRRRRSSPSYDDRDSRRIDERNNVNGRHRSQ